VRARVLSVDNGVIVDYRVQNGEESCCTHSRGVISRLGMKWGSQWMAESKGSNVLYLCIVLAH